MAITIPQNRTRYNTSAIGVGATPRATADDFGAQVFEGIGQVSKQASGVLLQEHQKRKRQNDLAVVQNRLNDLSTWDVNARQELNKAKGANAPEASKLYIGGYDEQVAALKADLTPDQLFAFERQTGKSRVTALETSLSYSNKQMDDYRAGQQAAYIANQSQNGLIGYQNQSVVDESWTNVQDSIKAYGNTNGQSQEEITNNTNTAKAEYYNGVITEAVNGKDYGLAKTYLNKYGESLTTTQRERLNTAINDGDMLVKTQSVTDQVMAMGSTEKDALSYVRENYEGKERDQIVQRVKVRYAENKQTQIFNDQKASYEAYNQILNGQDIDVLNASNLNPAVQKSLADYKSAIQSNKPVVTTSENKSRLDFLYADHPQQFMNTNLMQYRSTLSDADFDNYTYLQNEMIRKAEEAKKGGKPFSPVSELYTPKSYMTRVSKDFGIYDPDKTAQKQSEEYKQYYSSFADNVDAELIEAQRTKGEKLTWEEEKRIIDNAAAYWKVNVKRSDYIFDDDVMVGNITSQNLQDEDYYAEVDGMPEDIAIKLTEYLISNNIPPTPENVQYAYQQGKYK